MGPGLPQLHGAKCGYVHCMFTGYENKWLIDFLLCWYHKLDIASAVYRQLAAER